MSGVDVAECTVDELHRAWTRGDTVLDVREPGEYVEGHVPAAVLIPLGELAARTGEVPGSRPVFVICRSGRRSLTAARTLAAAGISATSVRGGTIAWLEAGHPSARGMEPGRR